jgi:shikimate dehydrogenase
MPFKQRAYEVSNTLSKQARNAAAVNTLIIDEKGGVSGDNTDGPGLVTDVLSNLGWQIRGKTLLLLGAGGAARGILQSLCEQAPKSLVIANRTESKAYSLADQYAGIARVSASSISRLAEPYDLIINATGASLQGGALDIPDGLISTQTQCYDLSYSINETPFIRWARSQGAAETADGLGMLVEQAAVAFQLWHGELPKTQSVIAQIKRLMKNGK